MNIIKHQKKYKYLEFRNKADFIISFIFFLSVILSLTSLIGFCLNYFLPNVFTVKPNESESCMTDNISYCNISDDIQFTKFIHLGVDGVSWLFIDDLRNLLHEHSHEYITYTTFIKYTSELLKTWFTGQDNVKLSLFKVKGDTIFSNYNRKYGKKIHLYGNLANFRIVLPTLNGMFWDYTNKLDVQPFDKHRAFSYWFANENHEKFLKLLNTWNKNNVSLVSFASDTDHIQHHQGGRTKYTNFSYSEAIGKRLAEDIVFVKDWIDKHPDYLLILSADHGHDELVMEDDGVMRKKVHGGIIEKNNTGWFIYYNPKLTPSTRTMNVTDIASTWAKYVKNIDIPANSVGEPQNPMKYIRNEVKIRQQGLAQLWHICRSSTKYCSGPAYNSSLSDPEMYFKGIEELAEKEGGIKNNKRFKRAKSKIKLLHLHDIVSFSANEAFPENISVNELRKIVEENNNRDEKEINQENFGEMKITASEAGEILQRFEIFSTDAKKMHDYIYSLIIISSPEIDRKMSVVYVKMKNFSYIFCSVLDSFLIWKIMLKILFRKYKRSKKNIQKSNTLDLNEIRTNNVTVEKNDGERRKDNSNLNMERDNSERNVILSSSDARYDSSNDLKIDEKDNENNFIYKVLKLSIFGIVAVLLFRFNKKYILYLSDDLDEFNKLDYQDTMFGFKLFDRQFVGLLYEISIYVFIFCIIHLICGIFVRGRSENGERYVNNSEKLSFYFEEGLDWNDNKGEKILNIQESIFLFVYSLCFYLFSKDFSSSGIFSYFSLSVGKANQKEGFKGNHTKVFSIFMIFYLIMVEIGVPLLHHLGFIFEKTSKGKLEDDNEKTNKRNLRNAIEKNKKYLFYIWLIFIFVNFYVWVSPYGSRVYVKDLQLQGLFVSICSVLILIIFAVISRKESYPNLSESKKESSVYLSRTRITILPNPLRFGYVFKKTSSLWEAFSESFSAYFPFFIPTILISTSIMVYHRCHWGVYMFHFIFGKFVVYPCVGIAMKSVGSYLSSSSSLTQVISRLLCVLEVFVGACIIRIVSVYEEISLFAWFYSLGEQANFDVDTINPWHGVSSLETYPALTVIMMAFEKLGLCLFAFNDSYFNYRAALEAVGISPGVIRRMGEEKKEGKKSEDYEEKYYNGKGNLEEGKFEERIKKENMNNNDRKDLDSYEEKKSYAQMYCVGYECSPFNYSLDSLYFVVVMSCFVLEPIFIAFLNCSHLMHYFTSLSSIEAYFVSQPLLVYLGAIVTLIVMSSLGHVGHCFFCRCLCKSHDSKSKSELAEKSILQ